MAGESDHTGADAPVAPTGSRLPGVEGLRGLAAVSVMVGHVAVLLLAADYDPSPFLGLGVATMLRGVILFFVLSGFLLYRPFVSAALAGRPRPSTRSFYRNRALRIFPAYLVILLAAGLVLGVAVTQAVQPGQDEDLTLRLGFLTDPLLLVLNLFMVQGMVPQGVQTGLSVSWSLVPELCFYVVLPALGLLAVRLARRRRLWAALAPGLLMLVVGLTGRLVANAWVGTGTEQELAVRQNGESWSAVLCNSLLANADLFGLGMLVAALVAAHRAGLIGDRAATTWRRVGLAGVPLGGIGALASGSPQGANPWFGVASAGLLLFLMLPGNGRLRRLCLAFLESRPMYGLGLISYSIYLWHFPLLCFLLLHVDALRYGSLSMLALDVLVASAATLALATLTYRYVEAPALRRKRHATAPVPHQPPPDTAGTAAEPAPVLPAQRAPLEAALPETARPETARPETALPETALPDTALPEPAAPEGAELAGS